MIAIFVDRLITPSETLIVGAYFFKGPMRWLTPFFRYDAVHYFRIAHLGYRGEWGLYAFFPVYPLTLKAFSGLFTSWISAPPARYVAAGLVANLSFLLIGAEFLRRLYEKEFKRSNGLLVAMLLLASPYAFYYLALYTEALFLCLTVTAFYFARTKRWLVASLLAALASGTRLQGMFLFPAFVIEYLHQKEWRIRNLRADVLWLLLCPVGFVTYIYSIGGPKVYISHAGAWTQRVLNLNIFYPVYRFFTHSLETKKFDFSDTVAVFSIFAAVFFFCYGWKKLRPSYLIYAAFSLAVPLITTVVQAVGRYYGAIFPLYFAAGLFFEKRQWALILVVSLSGMLTGLLVTYFVNGWWVA